MLTEITNHSFFIIRSTVVSSKRIEDTARSHKSFREVTKHMDVNTMLSLFNKHRHNNGTTLVNQLANNHTKSLHAHRLRCRMWKQDENVPV
jgi:hypothetical protein